ncbi:hypothetical protein LARI1_G003900 [Lachnellula arida]|uniref:Uncharacterized protein n=1 Tax=Lachnellula arida TaxID=1316785 RepID=A0A8T9B9X9_9HELO|nr:hypothetical protein LARI1_G003900 [Lachnellula arida]
MSTTYTAILAAAADNARLLKTLSETDYAFSALQQNNSHITTLKKEAVQEEWLLKKRSQTVAKEYREHVEYKSSHLKRLAYQLGGKKEQFEAEACKEEREWLEAVQRELNVKNSLEQIRRNLADAVSTNADLHAAAAIHSSAQAELDALYSSVFDGPTPDVPGEDEKEAEVVAAEGTSNALQLSFTAENKAHAVLLDAHNYLIRAQAKIEDALTAARAAAWDGGNHAAAKSNALRKAHLHVSEVEILMLQARRVQPLIKPIGKMEIPELRFMTDVVFNDFSSNRNVKERIKEAQRMLALAKQNLKRELDAAKDRIAVTEGELNNARRILGKKKEELQQIRAAAFDRVASGENGSFTLASNANFGSTVHMRLLLDNEKRGDAQLFTQKMATTTTTKTPNLEFTKLNSILSLYTNPTSATTPSDPTHPTTIIFCAWMGISPKSRYLNSFYNHYHSLYPSARIISVLSNNSFFSWTSTAARLDLHRPIVSAIETDPNPQSKRNILVHVMSNGGALGFVDTCKLYKEKTGAELKLKGIVFDSAPGQYTFSSAYYGISQNFPKGMLWYPIAAFSWVALALLGRTSLGPCVRIEGSRSALNDFEVVDENAKRVYIYSDSDGVVNWQSVEAHAHDAETKGFGTGNLMLEKWQGSGHIQHMLKDSDRYWSVVTQLWSSCSS